MNLAAQKAEREPIEEVFRDEESLFVRDVVEGQLVRFEKAVTSDFHADVALTIDGSPITVKAAVPATDAQGNIINDAEGLPIPRRTTIYDATRQLCAQQGRENPIPVLCHQDHLTPVGVCRVCMVEIQQERRGRKMVQLVPACTRRVEPGMMVHTVASPDDGVRQKLLASVRVITELLAGDHLLEQHRSADFPTPLEQLAARFLGDKTPRFASNEKPRSRDDSSFVIAVDHSACILCDRCVRACTQVKQNNVIGRTGKGYTAKIGFDLDLPMGESSCVSCGECMISCPTTALTFRDRIRKLEMHELDRHEFPTVEDLHAIPLFRSLPAKFLEWNTGAVRRRVFQPGDFLCKEGEYGSTAYVIVTGEFEILKTFPGGTGTTTRTPPQRGWLAWMSGKKPQQTIGGGIEKSLGMRTPADLILGEMTCMNNHPRSATVVARTPSEVLEINRNILFYLQRNPESRRELQRVYRERALRGHLDQLAMFQQLSPEARNDCLAFLSTRIDLIYVDPGEVVFREGDAADDLFLSRLGYVKFTRQTEGDGILVLNYFGPDRLFGEIAVLTDRRGLQGADDPVQQIYAAVEDLVPANQRGIRGTTCLALDHVELVRIHGNDLRALIRRQPELAPVLIEHIRSLLSKSAQVGVQKAFPLGEFLDQGLYHAQKLLVLDLEACTRCDECTRACADTHGGQTRLIREGLRFDKFLVASACRSCRDPYCLVGCPVDAIHRVSSPDRPGAVEITIENHCIGCGLCANNCPYGNITIQQESRQVADPNRPGRTMAVPSCRATTCDLCHHLVGPDEDPSCVFACPHNAAFRMTGDQLMHVVQGILPLDQLLRR